MNRDERHAAHVQGRSYSSLHRANNTSLDHELEISEPEEDEVTVSLPCSAWIPPISKPTL